MKIKFDDLQQVLQILLDKAKIAGFNDISIDIDNYWFVASDEREIVNYNIPELCVGSINDDLEYLNKILNGKNLPTPVDFERLGNILICIGEKISCSDKLY